MKKSELTRCLQKLSFAILIILFAFGAVVSCDNGFVIAILPSRESGAKKEYTNLKLDPIEFTEHDKGHITKTYGDTPFTNAVKGGYKGSGLITYSSSDMTVATVSSSGLVTILRVGSTIITAEKVADAVYAYAQTDYTLTVNLIDMVSIPAGTFISAFYMGKYEITQALYELVMGTNPSNFKSSPQTGEIQGKRPVENVTWYDALEFCNKLSAMEGLQSVYTISGRTPSSGYPISNATVTADFTKNGYRLPTEAQWEYACRAGTTTAYNTGATISDNTGWYASNSGSKTHEVGLKSANAWGLYDMHGNVWEWCWDWSSVLNPETQKPRYIFMLRGGSWSSSAEELRSENGKIIYTTDNTFLLGQYDDIGFRLIRP
jgi:formylglycine-generating enzyme required for sulfatase activity